MAAGSEERIVSANGVDLCLQTFGDPADPPVLLIAGGGASMLHYPAPVCERLADFGRFVVRYDHRDTGRSVTYPAGEVPYDGADLTQDALGVLDALGLARAHVVGFSMGGGIAQDIVIEQPERAASVTLVSTSPVGSDEDLPGMSDEVAAGFAALTEPDWSDRAAAVEYLFELERLCAAPGRPVDERYLRELVEATYERADRIGSLTNHFQLADESDHGPGALRAVVVPALVIHGTEDPLFPIAHGRALASAIPNASLIELEGSGHELPPRVWEQFVAATATHTA